MNIDRRKMDKILDEAFRAVGYDLTEKTPGERKSLKAKEMWDEGKSTREIADVLGITTDYTYILFTEQGVDVGAKRLKETEELHKKIVELRTRGRKYKEIMYEVGCCHSTVLRVLDNAGMVKKRKKR